ncbi:SAM-dependent methyltransferase [Streptomonospora sediminis]
MSVERAYFEGIYRGSADPWGLRASWYERRKRALTLASLPHERYKRAFEPGCAIGALTRDLAARCDELVAWEPIASPRQRAEYDLAGFDHVRVLQAGVPWQWPRGTFDLIVLSELLYYFDDADLHSVLDHTAASLRPGGTVVAVHWRHPAPDHTRPGDDAHRVLAAHGGFAHVACHREADFRIDVYTAGSAVPPSVAQREGLV